MNRYVALAFALFSSSVYAQEYICRNVGPDWIWFSDHIALSVTYVAVGAPGRTYEVATGPSIGGKPLGWKSKHSGSSKFSAWGLGAVHIRQSDSGQPFKVCVSAKDISAITIFKREF